MRWRRSWRRGRSVGLTVSRQSRGRRGRRRPGQERRGPVPSACWPEVARGDSTSMASALPSHVLSRNCGPEPQVPPFRAYSFRSERGPNRPQPTAAAAATRSCSSSRRRSARGRAPGRRTGGQCAASTHALPVVLMQQRQVPPVPSELHEVVPLRNSSAVGGEDRGPRQWRRSGVSSPCRVAGRGGDQSRGDLASGLPIERPSGRHITQSCRRPRPGLGP